MVHIVTVRPWNDGKQDDEAIMVQLPARLTQKAKQMLANTLVVFYGIPMFVKDGVDMTYYQIKSLYGEPDSHTGDIKLQAANMPLLTGSVKGKGWNHNPWIHRRGDIVQGDLDFSLHCW